MNVFKKTWLYIKNYFTASIHRKIFLLCVFLGIAIYIIGSIFSSTVAVILACIFFVGAAFVSMVETMQTRNIFYKQVSRMKVEHYKKIIDAGGSELDVLTDPVFSQEEQKYISRRKRIYAFVILGKALIIILLFALIFGQADIIM